MTITELNKDIFMVPKEYILVHCVSSDFAMGAGVAKEFTKRGVKDEILSDIIINYSLKERVGRCVITFATGWRAEFNLITKERYWHKPTYNSLRLVIEDMRRACLPIGGLKLAMPKIGCGLDRLQWYKVKDILENVFSDIDIEILVCSID